MKIAILSPQETKKAETFIQNHISHLPFEKIVIYGGNFPYITKTDKPSLLLRRWHKLINTLKDIVGFDTQTFKEYQLKKLLRKHNIDLVFAEYLITGAEVQHICKVVDVPIIVIALGYEISQYDIIQLYKEKYKSLFDYAKNIIVVSNHMTKNLLSLGCPEKKIIYSPASASDDFFKLKPHFTNKNVLAVGRFVDKKAPHLTIQAFNEALKVVPESQLIMAGDGPLLAGCKALAKQLNIETKVVFKGKISMEEHKQLLENTYMFVQHSRVAENGDSEGTPVAILEASAAGIPIVSTLHAGIPQVVIANKTGFLVPENDVASMAVKMIKLLQDKELAMQFGNGGKFYVKEHFTLDNHIKTISTCIKG